MGETLIGAVLNNLLVLMPFVIVKSYERGVRWRFGQDPHELLPGIHWKFWLYHQVEISNITDEVIELQVQSVITADEKLVCFSVIIGFRIVDIVKHWTSVQDFRESTSGLAKTHLAQRVREQSLKDLIADTKKLETSLRGTLTTKFKDWGTEVFSVGFADFAEVPQQIRLFTNGPSALHHLGI